jgi:hypothetical protein
MVLFRKYTIIYNKKFTDLCGNRITVSKAKIKNKKLKLNIGKTQKIANTKAPDIFI